MENRHIFLDSVFFYGVDEVVHHGNPTTHFNRARRILFDCPFNQSHW
jgi:hypothetical protein